MTQQSIMKLKTVLDSLLETEKFSYRLYSLSNLYNVLNELRVDVLEIEEDIFITPFYGDDSGIRELYEYSLDIFVTEKSIVEELILSKTGKSKIGDICPTLYKQLMNNYIELIYPTTTIEKKTIIEYIDELYQSKNIEKLIRENHKDGYDEKNFFFEYY